MSSIMSASSSTRSLHSGEVQRAPTEVVQDPARSPHHHLNALLERGDLPVDALPSVDRQHLLTGEQAQLVQLLGHLDREFPGGTEHQCAHVWGVGRQSFGHGDAERGGLARARLGLAKQIAAFQDQGDGLLLDGTRFDEAHLVYGLEHRCAQAELLEIVHVTFSRATLRRNARR